MTFKDKIIIKILKFTIKNNWIYSKICNYNWWCKLVEKYARKIIDNL